MARNPKHFYEFGPFQLDPAERVLTCAGKPVQLTPKAFDTLLVLVRRNGHTVKKDELFKEVWPDTFVEDGNLAVNVFALRKALGQANGGGEYIETVPKRGYRFTAQVRERIAGPDVTTAPAEADATQTVGQAKDAESKSVLLWIGICLAVLAIAGGGTLVYRARTKPFLGPSDSVLVADFRNSTGDPVFDGTLKQALTIGLTQSPFLNVVSEDKVGETLKLMTRPANTPLTPEIAREVCERTGGTAYIAGTVATLGSQYVLTLQAANCRSGDVVAQQQFTAMAKEKVIAGLGDAAAKLRGQLGESLATVQKYDVPLEEATTSSLEGLKAYSLAYAEANRGSYLTAIPLYKHAVELDPNFAIAYARLGQSYANSSQGELADESIKQAYERRARASEREKFYIITRYFELVTEEVDKRIEALELWKTMYPRDPVARNDLAAEYNDMGRFSEGLAEAQEAVRLAPSHYTAYEVLGMAYLGLNRFAEAKEVRQKQLALNVSNHWDHSDLYGIAAVENDPAGMQREVDWAKGKTYEFVLLEAVGQTLAAEGKVQKAREAYRDCIESARRGKFANIAKTRAVDLDLMQTLLETSPHISEETRAAPSTFAHRNALANAGHVYAMRGDARRVTAITDELVKRSPTGTYVNKVWVPSIRAELEISRGNGAQAIALLQEAPAYEFGWKAQNWANYDRGRAYLQIKRGKEAAAEFQKILDHRGVCMAGSLSSLVYALSHLQFARAQAMSGDAAAARTAYQNFFNLWKDADPDVPILKQARAEYAKL